jgi:hypothetical protein
MGRASSNKKVNRAASTGGGRTSRGRTPILWYSTIFLVVAVGVLTVFASAKDLRQTAADTTAPQVGKDHWHAAFGIYVCDSWVPAANLSDKHRDRAGIHSHGDGLIHTHPAVPSAAGKNATLSKFFEELDIKVSSSSLSLPKSTGAKRLSLKNGDKCGKTAGKIQAVVFKNQADNKGTPLKGNPGDWKIENGKLITIGFVSEGTVLQPPPSAANLADPKDLQGNPITPNASTPPLPETPTSAAPPTSAGTPTTTKP